jgi:protein-S-isoprenylcysteine O-methyltransferase Ste14
MKFALPPETAMRVLWGAWWLTWWAAALWSDRSVKRPAARDQVIYRVFVAIGAMLLFGLYRHRIESEVRLWRATPTAAWAMVGLAMAGFLFTWWARLHLGRLWSSNVARKAGHHVVDTGPYGIVRHPIYTGIILASCATAAMRGTMAGWIGVAVMTAGWYIKARMEEHFLREELGADGYTRYARRVPMLLPRPWRTTSRSAGRPTGSRT